MSVSLNNRTSERNSPSTCGEVSEPPPSAASVSIFAFFFTDILPISTPAVAIFVVVFFFDSERRPLADPSLNVHSNTKVA